LGESASASFVVSRVFNIVAIEAALTPEEYRGYLKGNMLKYVWRERKKGGDESIQKALWYGSRLTARD
jgi:hypothetical protein